MSYDLKIVDKDSNEPCYSPEKHSLGGGTYAVGGTNELWLNITYNYAPFYYETIDAEDGIRILHGMDVQDSLPIIGKAIKKLTGEETADYWEANAGNARLALINLLLLASKAPPNSMWQVE